MDFQVIFVSTRGFVLEVNDGVFFARADYQILVNGNVYDETDHVVHTVYGLEPDHEYEISVRMGTECSPVRKVHTEKEFVTLNVKEFGAKGDGKSDDTLFIQTAINVCPPGGRVYIPEGEYKIYGLFLKSHMVLDMEKNAVLSAYCDRKALPILPGMIQSQDGTAEYNPGTWEGDPEPMFLSVINGFAVEDVVITGGGTIDGNAQQGDWWEEPRKKVGGAYRPRMIFLNRCKNVTVFGITVKNSPSWTLHPYFSENIRWMDMKVLNPETSPNTDGINPDSSKNVDVIGLEISVGDDCMAINSGRYYMGNKYKTPSENIMVRQCYMRKGHGSVVIGSAMAGGVRHVRCEKCLFEGTDRGLRIKTKRGRGKDAIIEDIYFKDIKMERVKTPFVVNSFYFCNEPDGESEYVQCKSPLPVDDRTPHIKDLTFENITATDCQVAAAYIYGLPEAKIESLEMKNIKVSFAENAKADYPAMMLDVEWCCKKGIYINNVHRLILEQIEVSGADGEEIELQNIDQIAGEHTCLKR